MVGDRIFKARSAKPAIRHVDLNLQTKLALRADGKDIPYDQHAQHQFGIDRRTASVAVIGGQLLRHPAKIKQRVQLAHQMIHRNQLLKTDIVEKLSLTPLKTTHHQHALP